MRKISKIKNLSGLLDLASIPQYQNGGEQVVEEKNKIQNDKNYFIKNWLNQRKQILARNATNNRFYDFVRYVFGNEESIAQDEINRQMQNLNSVNEFEMSTNPALFKSSFSDKQNKKHLEDVYNRYVDRENNTAALTNEDLSNLSIFFKGAYSPKNHVINYEEDPKNNIIIHERTHSLRPFPQESTIHLLKYDNPEATFMKGDFGNIYNKDIEKDSYLDDASEIYSRLMEFRYMNKLDPKKIYNKSDIQRMRNSNTIYDPDILNRYNDDYVERLLNKVAYNKINNEQQLLAMNTSNYLDDAFNDYSEGGIHIKKKNRGKFTKSAKQHGMSVQEYARKVVNDPNATTLQKRRAQFAINAKKFKH